MKAETGILRLLVFLGAGWLVYLLAPILTPFVAAGLLAYLGDPLVDRLQKMKLGRTPAVVLVFVLIFVLLISLVALVGPLIKAQVAVLAKQLPVYVSWLESHFLPRIIDLLGIEKGDTEIGLAALLADNWQKASGYAGNALATVSRGGGFIVTGIINLFLIPVVTFYLLRDWDEIVKRAAALVPDSRQAEIFALFRESDKVLGAFLRGQLLVMFGLAIIYTAGLALVGLDNALAIGVVAGVVSFVPYLGLFVGIVLAGLAAIVQTGSILTVALVVVVFVAGQMVEGMFLTPKLVGNRIGLHPVLVIFAVMAGGQLFGFFGILLALPLAAVVSVAARFAYRHYREELGHPVPPAQDPD
ncbi:MAG: AI-2E family transporter [Gammaproteobacteria bacterium]|nr:AI-2E family transporter [Gammaproteobacteria bacterium]